MSIDLTDVSIVDAHCHGLRVEDLLAGASTWADNITLIGMCMASSATADDALKAQVSQLTESTIFAQAGRRWLADFLGVDLAEVEEERRRRLETDAGSYLSSLIEDQNISDLLVDDGYPQPMVDPEGFGRLLGVRAHRVVRIEPIIDRLLPTVSGADELIDAFMAELEATGPDSRVVGYKSVIAYRTGLDITDPSVTEVRSGFEAWRDSGFQPGPLGKPVRDRLLHVTCRVAARQDRPVHIHSGAGDPDVVLARARPAGLAPVLATHPRTAVVLIHAGFPWVEEAAYLAGMYPNAHVELSLFSPWATLDLDRVFATVLGIVPTSKIMYGSDEASEPEVLWLSARLGRKALERVLQAAVERDLLTESEARSAGEAVLGGNAARLHGLSLA